MLEYEASLVLETRELEGQEAEKAANMAREELLAIEAQERAEKEAQDQAAAHLKTAAKAQEHFLKLEEQYLAGQTFDALSVAQAPSPWEHTVRGARRTPKGQKQSSNQVGQMMG